LIPTAGGDTASFDGEALWRGVDAPWMESLRWSRDGGGRLASGVILGLGDAPYRLIYQAQVDRYGRLRQLSVDHPWGWPEALRLRGDGEGVWFDGLGEAARDIEGCVDLQLGPSVFFLGLALGRRRRGDAGAGGDIGRVDPTAFSVTPQPLDPRAETLTLDSGDLPDGVAGWFERLAGGRAAADAAPDTIVENPPIGTMQG